MSNNNLKVILLDTVLYAAFMMVCICFIVSSIQGRDNGQGCKDAVYIPGVIMGCSGTAWNGTNCQGVSGLQGNRLPGGCASTETKCKCVPQGNDPSPYLLMACECWPE